jgi:hypothetical protein
MRFHGQIYIYCLVGLVSIAGCTVGARVTLTTAPAAAPGGVSMPVSVPTHAETVTRAINEGKIPLDEGLKQFGEMLAKASNPDPLVLALDAQASSGRRSENEEASSNTVQNLAEAVVGIRRGKPIDTLARVLGVSAFADHRENDHDVDDLFDALLEREEARHAAALSTTGASDLSESGHVDAFLIHYFVGRRKWSS